MIRKTRLYLAGLVAFLIGMPLAEKADAGVEDIIFSSIDLAYGITDLAGGS